MSIELRDQESRMGTEQRDQETRKNAKIERQKDLNRDELAKAEFAFRDKDARMKAEISQQKDQERDELPKTGAMMKKLAGVESTVNSRLTIAELAPARKLEELETERRAPRENHIQTWLFML